MAEVDGSKSRLSWGHPLAFCKVILLPIGLSVVTSFLTNHYQNNYASHERERSLFVDEARTFDVVVANYVQKVLNKSDGAPDAGQQIINNLVKQSNLLFSVTNQLSSQDRHLANDYRHMIADFRDVVPAADSVQHMQAFWNGASKILVARNELIAKLEE